MSSPKNIEEAERRLAALKMEYIKQRGTPHAKRIATEIYALEEWIVAHDRHKRKKGS